ncbi:hypothetical protein [Paenibacillus paeoniae]|uniref:Uncharacterized protein n=1 Tax=Paenibacillus paeoniae TaxID=2292705 RepID=A0A371P5P8_9BACL|nr:hypothetical protein [Paenibacillus paeoniae]REK71257.1 hypothetical protein DX130_22705 [Paenibacillus paeoniae]
MFYNPHENFYDRIRDYVFENKRLVSVVGILIILLIISVFLLIQLSKKEDPKYTTYNSYSCKEIIGSKPLSTNTDMTLSFFRATKIESELNIWNNFKDKLSSYHSVMNLVNESSKLIVQAEQINNANQPGTLSIPKEACYLSLSNSPDTFSQLNFQFDLPKIELYRWTKKYRRYLSDKEHKENNTIVIIGNHSYHTKQSFSQSFLFPVMKSQIIMYNLTTTDK